MQSKIKDLKQNIRRNAKGITVEYENGVMPVLKNKKRGRWYYEFTHISGTNYHIVGFCDANSKIITYYAHNALPDSQVLINSNLDPELSDYSRIGFNTVNSSSTIGLGIDLYDGYFYIRSSHQMATIRFNASKFNANAVRFYYEEGQAPDAEDVIKVNFGEKKFAYNIMPGFTPFIRAPIKHSCHQNARCSLRSYAIYLIVFGS